MKKTLTCLLLLLATIACQTKQKTDKHMINNELSPTLHQTWRTSTNMDLPEDANKPRIRDNGSEWHFHKDHTFQIKFWRYGMSMGYLYRQPITGNYTYNSHTQEISLTTFDSLHQQIYDNKQVETPYFVVKRMKENKHNRLGWNEEPDDFPQLENITLRILEQKDESRIQVQLSAYHKDIATTLSDTILFVKENLE